MITGHEGFVAAAYIVSALALAALIGGILLDQRGRKRDLAELEKAGVRRRSNRKPGKSE